VRSRAGYLNLIPKHLPCNSFSHGASARIAGANEQNLHPI